MVILVIVTTDYRLIIHSRSLKKISSHFLHQLECEQKTREMSLFRARDLVNFQSNSAFDPRAICPISEEGGLVLGTLQGDINLYTPKRDDQV